MSNKKIIFLIILSIFSISRVYGTSLIVKCERTVIRSHYHEILTCDRGEDGASDDFVGDYHNIFWKERCNHGNPTGYVDRVGTSNSGIEVCEEYALYIGNDRIDSMEAFVQRIPISELIKLLDTVILQQIYDPNMMGVNP